ncbi:MAG: U32 family peptidase [Oligoflexia bacterium]|nr:U32 family peptidase [Oligoflexia bacterium]
MAELLAPAGNPEKLEWAVAYGADAVYFGVKEFSLRSYAGNFDIDEAERGLKFLHSKNKKGYVTLNIYPFTSEYKKLVSTAKDLESIGADAFIVSDPGVINELKSNKIKTPLHISTQANTLSYQAVKAYAELGAKRINLARELSVYQVREIAELAKMDNTETEVFVHGAVCFSYSGRCAISDYLTGRRANRGECTHPCRWKYYLTEEKREGEYMPVTEDERGLYFFNSKEIALFQYLRELDQAGITSFKIEGRMKTVHYLATVLSIYRNIMDGNIMDEKTVLNMLSRINNRGYSTGFIKGGITPDDYQIDGNTPAGSSVFIANTEQVEKGKTVLRVRNRMEAGMVLEVLSPGLKISEIILPDQLVRTDGTATDVAQNGDFIVLEQPVPGYSVLRKVK